MNNEQSPVGLSNYSLEEYLQNHVTPDKTIESIVVTENVLILPYKYNDTYYFAEESANFTKYCRQQNKDFSFNILGDNISVRSLNSWDIWMPVIFIAKDVFLPTAINLVSNYLWDKIKGREKETPQVDVTFRAYHNNEVKELHYKGDATTFKENFEKIDINKW